MVIFSMQCRLMAPWKEWALQAEKNAIVCICGFMVDIIYTSQEKYIQQEMLCSILSLKGVKCP